jgi:hypothetical protein
MIFRGISMAIMCLCTVLQGCYREASEYKSLMLNADRVQATVNSKDCGNHGKFFYSFFRDGKKYYGASGRPDTYKCQEIEIGSIVSVYVDRTNPHVYSIQDPALVYEREHGWHFSMWPVIVLGLLVKAGTFFFRASRGSARPKSESQ